MIRTPLATAALTLAVLGAAGPAMAAPFADLAAIDREVALFTGAEPGEGGGALRPVDRRLRLAACAAPLALGWNGPRHDAVVVRCPVPGGWHIYVPAQSLTPAHGTAPVVARGESLTVMVEGEGFAVSEAGEALEPGAEGEWIRVRMASAGAGKTEPLRARIVRPGLVSVPLP